MRNAVRTTGAGGLTLIEILVVVAILGVLAALLVPRVIGRTDEARAVAARQDIATILQALRMYRLDSDRYPTSTQGLDALVGRPGSEPIPRNWKQYLDKVSKDPWGQPYQYLSPGIHSDVDVFSFGADGTAGGNGIDAEIGSWQL